jgi:hypothetical protein
MSSEDAATQALKIKALGNDAYKSRDFATAIAKYQEAWDLHKDITFLNNLAGRIIHSHISLAIMLSLMLVPFINDKQLLNSRLVTMMQQSRPRRMPSNKVESCVPTSS